MSRVLELICHPETPCGAGIGLSVRAERGAGGLLALRYRVAGDVEKLLFAPERSPPQRASGLWRTTCFELFVRQPASAAYREYNFSPSRAWAAYDFSAYRDGMDDASVPAPVIGVTHDARHADLDARVFLPDDAPLSIGLSAVVEEKGGRISYWALAHPPGKPDFHHPACFAQKLAAPDIS